MVRNLKIALATSVALLGSLFATTNAKAGWGHHHGGYHHGWGHGWGHHHHQGYYGGGLWGASVYGLPYYGGSFGGWGGSYTSLSIGIGPAYWGGFSYDYPRRYPYIYPGSLSSYDFYASPTVIPYPYSSYYRPYYSAGYYSGGSYAPYASSACGSSYYAASGCGVPVMGSACCDPCAGLPVDSSVPAAPAAPASTLPAAADSGVPSVRSLRNWIPSSNVTRSAIGHGREAVASSLVSTAGNSSVPSVSSAQPVTVEIATNLVPLSKTLLQAADAIFASGDYNQAAAAYARLTVRYGNHDELAVRRFIALVASGDCEQAAVMFEAASLAEQSLLAHALPSGGLAELYGATASERDKHADYLAAYALSHPDDGLALAMVGTWLELDGQSDRAQMFMQRAAVLAPRDELPTSPAHLVVTDISR